jgi:S1-C subfamily serine protease
MPESTRPSSQVQFLGTRRGSTSPSDSALLDAYTRTVNQVARLARPAVAHLSVHRPDNTTGTGSGFVFTPDGFLLTNSHVVHGAKELIAAFADGAEYRAWPIGEDPSTDTAVLRLDGGSTPGLSLGDSLRSRACVCRFHRHRAMDRLGADASRTGKARDSGSVGRHCTSATALGTRA